MRFKAIVILFFAFTVCKNISAQTALLHNYEISTDTQDGSKVLKGLLNRADIESDTSFKWFKENMKFGQADASCVCVSEECFKISDGCFLWHMVRGYAKSFACVLQAH